MRVACWITKAIDRHTLRICNTYCFFTVTVVTPTRLNVTSCLSCFVSNELSGPNSVTCWGMRNTLGKCDRNMVAQAVQWLIYGLDDRGIVVRFSATARVFTLLENLRTICGNHPTCYSVDTWDSFALDRQPGRSPSSCSQVKNQWSTTSSLLHCMHRDKCTTELSMTPLLWNIRVCVCVCVWARARTRAKELTSANILFPLR